MFKRDRKYIKEFSIIYYKEYINKNLSIDAKEHTLFDLAITFNNEKDYIQNCNPKDKFLCWAKTVTDGKIDSKVLSKYINLGDDKVNHIIAVRALDCNEEPPALYVYTPFIHKGISRKR